MEYITSSFGITVPYGGEVIVPKVEDGCSDLSADTAEEGEDMSERVVLFSRGGCSFAEKVKNAQAANYRLILLSDSASPSVLDKIGATTEEINELYLPVLMISHKNGQVLRNAYASSGSPPTISITKERSLSVYWEEIRNFLGNCLPGEGNGEDGDGEEDGEKDGEEKLKDSKLESCVSDYNRIRKGLERFSGENGDPEDRLAALDTFKPVFDKHNGVSDEL